MSAIRLVRLAVGSIRKNTMRSFLTMLGIIIGVAAVIGGLGASRAWDVPAGPAIVVAGLGLFLASLAVPARFSGDDGSARGTA